ncbi:suppressor of cytokine signaling 2 [Parasteatoda tepidariorum]|nr:suppressor of cytokine signaling 2 [Parasteatoda tepidariorum]XP_015930449.1 suppressor of cytokine signaling 2 [Parasteatoda tepidariorum]XP_042900757.1 suppressor of cytokine signaling 2 [Parasteatoda tepidariorum]
MLTTSLSVLDSAFSSPAASCPALEQEEVLNLFLVDLPVIESSLIGGPFVSVKDINWDLVSPKGSSSSRCKKTKQTLKSAMNHAIEPEEDLKKLINNETKLRLSGYYYGNLSWVDASHILKKTKVGTFLVRDSEHCNYLYALSVQTRRGPTSCRIEYENGCFRLDSSDDLSDKMPRFDSVTDLIDHYVHLTQNLPQKPTTKNLSPVWLDMDEENSRDVPVQIYKPLYKNVRSLQHMCRVNLVKLQKEGSLRTNVKNSACDMLPTMLKNYLKEYPYSQ